jgi:hypothetical protein
MKTRVINEYNREEIQRKYIDDILGSMDFMQIKDCLRDYLSRDKDRSSNYGLEVEIRREAPDILIDNWEDFAEPALLTSSGKSKNKPSTVGKE